MGFVGWQAMATEIETLKQRVARARPSVGFFYSVFVTLTAALFLAALFLDDPATRAALLDLGAKVLGPIAAACVAWLGVAHTVRNNRRQEVLKEWHANVRWAAELCLDGSEQRLLLGVGLLDALDNHPDLEEPEQAFIDAALDGIAEAYLESGFVGYYEGQERSDTP